MEYYGNNDWRDYLAHYGKKGMTWGKHKYTGIVNGEYIYGTERVGIRNRNFMTGSIVKRASQVKNPSNAYRRRVDAIQESINNALSDEARSKEKTKKDKKTDKKVDYDKDLAKTANDVIMGKYGAGDDRKKQIEKMGLSYAVVQNKVNELMGSSKRHTVTKDDLKKVESFYSKSKDKKDPDIANVKAVFSSGSKKKKKSSKDRSRLKTGSTKTIT